MIVLIFFAWEKSMPFVPPHTALVEGTTSTTYTHLLVQSILNIFHATVYGHHSKDFPCNALYIKKYGDTYLDRQEINDHKHNFKA